MNCHIQIFQKPAQKGARGSFALFQAKVIIIIKMIKVKIELTILIKLLIMYKIGGLIWAILCWIKEA